MMSVLPASRSAVPPIRPEYVRSPEVLTAIPLQRPLPWRERLWAQGWIRRTLILVVLALAWELIARWQGNELLLPTFSATIQALWSDTVSGELPAKIVISLELLLRGYAIGVVTALSLTTIAVSTRFGRDLLSTLASMFTPLPAVALLPLALLWFGLGATSIIFVLVHSVLWPLSINTFAGFQAVPEPLRMTGRNYGLRGLRYVFLILVPAALPSILAGLRLAWAFAWRTLIAAELVFGASSGRGGLGWYIFQNRNELLTDRVFAGLAVVVIIGLVVEVLGFNTLERLTVRRWGQQR